MDFITKESRSQVKMLCLEELVLKESPARQIDKIVEGMDTSYMLQITPWFQINTSVGLGGLSFGISLIDGDVSHDYNFCITPLGVVALVAVWMGVPSSSLGPKSIPSPATLNKRI